MDQSKGDHHDDDFAAVDASMISGSSPYQPTTEPVPHRRQFIGGLILDMQFVKSIPGLLKILEIIFSIIVAICLGSVGLCYRACGSISYLQFVSISAMIFTTVIFVVYAFNLPPKIILINWPLTDLICSVIYSVQYFIGSAVLAAKAETSAGKAAVAFGFFAALFHGASCWFAYNQFVIERNKRRTTVSHIVRVEEHIITQESR